MFHEQFLRRLSPSLPLSLQTLIHFTLTLLLLHSYFLLLLIHLEKSELPYKFANHKRDVPGVTMSPFLKKLGNEILKSFPDAASHTYILYLKICTVKGVHRESYTTERTLVSNLESGWMLLTIGFSNPKLDHKEKSPLLLMLEIHPSDKHFEQNMWGRRWNRHLMALYSDAGEMDRYFEVG